MLGIAGGLKLSANGDCFIDCWGRFPENEGICANGDFFTGCWSRLAENEGIFGIVGGLKVASNGGGEGNGRLAFLRNLFGGMLDGFGDGEVDGET